MLDRPQIGAGFEQAAGERIAETVRVNMRDTGQLPEGNERVPEGPYRRLQSASAVPEKIEVRFPWQCIECGQYLGGEDEAHACAGFRRTEGEPAIANGGAPESDSITDPQAGMQQQQDQRPSPQTGARQPDLIVIVEPPAGRQQRADLAGIEGQGGDDLRLGQPQSARRVARDESGVDAPVEKGAEAGEFLGLGCLLQGLIARCPPAIAQAHQDVGVDLGHQTDPLGFAESSQAAEYPHVVEACAAADFASFQVGEEVDDRAGKRESVLRGARILFDLREVPLCGRPGARMETAADALPIDPTLAPDGAIATGVVDALGSVGTASGMAAIEGKHGGILSDSQPLGTQLGTWKKME